MPFVDRGIELHPRITADMRSFSDLAQQRPGIFAFAWFSVAHATRPPLSAFERCIHELVAHPDAQVFVLIHHRAVGVAIVAAVVTLLDQCPGFLFFFLLRVDELFDVRVPIFERIHLRSATRFAAALHYVCDLIVNLQE